MTRRERVLGVVFLGSLAAAVCVFGLQLYLEKIQALDEQISKAELNKARLELAITNSFSGGVRRQDWTSSEAAPDVFLSRFDRIVRSVGWRTESTIFKGRKEGLVRFSITLTGSNDGLAVLLSALALWEKKLYIESVDASTSGAGRLRVTIEAGYEAD